MLLCYQIFYVIELEHFLILKLEDIDIDIPLDKKKIGVRFILTKRDKGHVIAEYT
jgi:hypothetical protein